MAITSPNAGTSQVTALAPSISQTGQRAATATIHWVDAQWVFPSASVHANNARHTLTTSVTKQSNSAPQPDWHVRYEIVGGVPAQFAANAGQTLEVPTDQLGQAHAEVVQRLGAGPGATRVGVQVIQPALPNLEAGRRLILGVGSTILTWNAANTNVQANKPVHVDTTTTQLKLQVNGPQTAEIGATVRFELIVTNVGNTAASGLTIRDTFDVGLTHLVAKSPIEKKLDDLPPGKSQSVFLSFQVTEPGELQHRVEVSGANVTGANETVTLTVEPPTVTQPALELDMTGPTTVKAGETAEFRIKLRNTGDVPLTNLRVVDRYAVGLEPTEATEGFAVDKEGFPIDQQGNRDRVLVWRIPKLAPGATQVFRVVCRCTTATRVCNSATVQCDQRPPLADEMCLQILPTEQPTTAKQTPTRPSAPNHEANLAGTQSSQPHIELAINTFRDNAQVGKQLRYQIEVTNASDKPDRNVQLIIQFPEGVRPARFGTVAPAQYHTSPGKLIFAPIKELRAGEKLTYDVLFDAMRPGKFRLDLKVSSSTLAAPITRHRPLDIVDR